MSGQWLALGPVTTRIHQGGCLDLVGEGSRGEVDRGRSDSGGSSKYQHSSLASIPGRYSAHTTWVFSGNDGESCQWKFLSGRLQIYDVDAITCPFADVLLHTEAKVSATQVGSCCKEFEDIFLLHLQDIKDYGPCEISL